MNYENCFYLYDLIFALRQQDINRMYYELMQIVKNLYSKINARFFK